jgi:RHS repeat-associated protein
MFSFKRSLLSISAINGISWEFGLDYLAGNGVNGIVGKGFNFPQNLQLQPSGSNVQLLTGQNTLDLFIQTSPGVYAPASNNTTQAELYRSGSGATDTFTMKSSAGTVTNFFGFDAPIATPGCPQSITDRYGSTQTYQWQSLGGVNQLLSVTDSYGRSINYSYYGSSGGYRLEQITDFLGRQINFQYDTLGHLIAVITPSINQAASGNTFPDGTAYVFQYDVNNSRSDRRDDLLKIWFPNEVAPFITAGARTVNVSQVYTSATPRYTVAYGQDPTDPDLYGRVISETVGDPLNAIGGAFQYLYTTSGLPSNLIDPSDPIVFRCVLTDRHGDQTLYDFNAAGMPSRVEVIRTRSKINIPSFVTFPSYVTWTQYNELNQPLLQVLPEGNSVQYNYETGVITGLPTYNRRAGLLLSRTALPGNTIGIPSRAGSSGQTQLTERYFYEPIFNQQCAMIERRGNPIDGSDDYFTPQNGGTTPTDADRSRYATLTYFDYQKDAVTTVTGDTALQAALGLTSTQIQTLITFVSNQMSATGGTGGIPAGFPLNLGDINGEGTGNGASSGLPDATHTGNVIMIQHPAVTLVGSSTPNQVRQELFTTNARGQTTTHTDSEGNLRVQVRYPFNDPEGNGGATDLNLGINGGKQYGRLKEIHVDADPNDVLSLVGTDGDLVDFIPGKISRTNTPGIYQDLVTRFEGGSGASGSGCASCAYDAMGNPLAQTDPRGFTTRYDRNELGEAFRTISPQPYNFTVEKYFDANRNATRLDTEDQQPAYTSSDPASACYAQFTPSGSGGTAHVPMQPGPGGSVRPGWFTNLYQFDLLDNKTQDDIDATGSNPANLITGYLYDPNQNLIQITKPQGNIVEYDYDERNLRIATRVGMVPGGEPGSITVIPYDGNGNLLQTIGPAQRGASGNWQTVTLEDAFRSGLALTHSGDFVLENTYDGFDRVILVTDAVGDTIDTGNGGSLANPFMDPDGRVIQSISYGPIGGATPTNRSGSSNVQLAATIARFDEAGRPYEEQRDVSLATGTTLPSGRAVTHTGGGLAANSTANNHTGTVTLTSGGDSYALNRALYDRANRTVGTLADNTAQTSTTFDGASRPIQSTDAVGNMVQNTFDANGNAILSTRTDVCTITTPTVANEVFQSAMLYDSLDQLVVQAQQGADGTLDLEIFSCGNAPSQVPNDAIVTRFGFDSRKNPVLEIDPKGNTMITVFDGTSRKIGEQQHLRIAGHGSNPPVANQTNAALTPSSSALAPSGSFLPGAAACIVTTSVLDGNGRMTQLIDDRGDITLFQFDTMDRQTIMTFHDGSTRTSVYDEASDVVTYTDENGSVFSNTFDPLGRKTAVGIAPAAGVSGTTAQSFQFDGLSRNTFARDSVGATNADVTSVYDSLNRLLEESQVYGGNTRNVTNTAFVSAPATGFEFPNNRQLANTYDLLYRRALVQDVTNSVNVAAWQFFGPSRVAEVTLGNGLICSWLNNARTNSAVQPAVANPAWGNQSSDRLGYDGASRPITKRYLAGGINGSTGAYNNSSAVVGFTTEYDPSSNKYYERHLHCEERSHLYEPFSNGVPTGGYDSLNRLRQYQRGTLTSNDGFEGNGGGSISAPITLPNTDMQRTYDLDSLGNWRRSMFTPEGGSQQTEIRQHNGLNEITRIQNGASQTNLSYDGLPGASNGNLANDGTRSYKWDALNRLLQVNRVSDGSIIGQYVYDALNRRIRKTVSNGGLSGTIPNGTTDCLYSGWRCVEERNPFGGGGSTDTPTMQYIWGIYLDELLQQFNIAALNNFSANSALYPLQDLLYRTTGLADSSGTVREAYDTDAYGNTLVFRNAGTPPGAIAWTDSDTQVDFPTCPFIFTGQRYDADTQHYYYKRRYYLSHIGRFLSRDPLEFKVSINLYEYVGSNPAAVVDPIGLARHHWFMRYWRTPGKGQDIVNALCPGLIISIDRFTTDYTKEEHDLLHSWVGPEIRYQVYQHLYEGLVAASRTCCDFLIGMKALMFASNAAIFIAHQRGVLVGPVSTFDLINFYDTRKPPKSTRTEFELKIEQACGCSDEDKRQTDIQVWKTYSVFIEKLRADLKLNEPTIWDNIREIFDHPIIVPVPEIPVPIAPPQFAPPSTPPVTVPLPIAA